MESPEPVVVAPDSERLVLLSDPQPALVFAERRLPLRVVDPAPAPVVVPSETVFTPVAVLVPEPARMVQTGFPGVRGAKGDKGDKGDPGGTGVLARPIGAVVQGLRIVRSDAGVIYPVDLANESHAGQVIGLALQSVTVLGTDVNIQLAGPVTDSGWNWAPGLVWCGTDGALTQAPPASGWLLQVGRVIGPDTIDVDLSYPIYRG